MRRARVSLAIAFGAVLLAGLILISPIGGTIFGGQDAEKAGSTSNNVAGSDSRLSKSRSSSSSPTKSRGQEKGLGSAESLLMPGMARISPEAVAKILKDTDNGPLAASALFWTDDAAIWEQARKLVKTDRLFAAAIALASSDQQERFDAALILIDLDHSNPLGYMAAAEAALSMGDTAKAKSLLAEIPSETKLNLYSSDYRTGQDQLLTISGYSPVERGLLLSRDRSQQSVIRSISSLVSVYFNDIDGDEQAARASTILDLVDGCRDSFGKEMPYAISSQLSRIEETTLRRLPDDFVLDDSTSVAQRARDLSSSRIAEIDKQERISNALDNLDRPTIEKYYSILNAEGELHASKWLIGE